MARPPLKAAHTAATKALVVKYNAEWLALVNAYLDEQGWKQEVVEKRVWKGPLK